MSNIFCLLYLTFFVATSITKLFLFFGTNKVKNLMQFSKNYSTFTIVKKLSEIWVWNPGSG
jgi:hypothetical protein